MNIINTVIIHGARIDHYLTGKLLLCISVFLNFHFIFQVEKIKKRCEI